MKRPIPEIESEYNKFFQILENLQIEKRAEKAKSLTINHKTAIASVISALTNKPEGKTADELKNIKKETTIDDDQKGVKKNSDISKKPKSAKSKKGKK